MQTKKIKKKNLLFLTTYSSYNAFKNQTIDQAPILSLFMAIQLKKQQRQKELLKKLGIKPEDLEEKFILASGKGGQKVNKTSSAVYLKHRPTGIEAKASKDRSRETNRYLAREKLIETYQSQILGLKTKKAKQLQKKKKQKQRRAKKSAQKYKTSQVDQPADKKEIL